MRAMARRVGHRGNRTITILYYLATSSGPKAKPLVCPPDPPPSRNGVITGFMGWAQAHPQYMNEAPVETEFRYLTEAWPCKR
jgi:hypothetical protein